MRGIDETEAIVDDTLDQIEDVRLIIHPDIFLDEDIDKVIEMVLAVYKNNDISLGELLSSIEIQGLSLNDTVKVYAGLYNEIEENEVVRITDKEQVNLWEH